MNSPPGAPRWRVRADRVRDVPLEALAVELGYRQDPRNPARWKLPGSALSITGTRFFDHCRGGGGGGAIDLVMHARACRFGEAVEFLESRAGLPLPAAPTGSQPALDRPAAGLQLPPRDGRTFKGMAPGSRKAHGGFWLPAAAADHPDALLLVESAVDALSAIRLLAPDLPPDTLVVSTAGIASAFPRWLLAFGAPPDPLRLRRRPRR